MATKTRKNVFSKINILFNNNIQNWVKNTQKLPYGLIYESMYVVLRQIISYSNQ